MTKSLVVVESPSKAKTVNKYLGKDYIVEATIGHIKNLPEKDFGVDIDNGYKPKFITIAGKEKVIKKIVELAKKSDKVFIATDPDREGEAIACDISDEIKKAVKDKLQIKRVLFEEITKTGIQRAMSNPKDIDMNLVDAQTARRVLDRILGYKVSPFLWKVFYYGLSAGRVQSVALKLICEREEEIRNFSPIEYWSIDAIFSKPSGSSKSFPSKLYKIDENIIKYNGEDPKIESLEQAHKILEDLKDNKFKVIDIQSKEVKKNPPAPFTTSVLQQAASTQLGFSPKKTMNLAQKLYEGVEIVKGEGNIGLITYMRTDSTRVSPEAINSVRKYILDNFGNEYLPKEPNVFNKKSKNIQEAHEAIRPTDINITPDKLKKIDKSLYQLYKLIWERFVASQMHNAILNQKTVLIKAISPKGLTKEYIFKTVGSEIKFSGFLKLYKDIKEEKAEEDEEEDTLLPDISVGEMLKALSITKNRHETKPPPRYTESSLIKQLDNLGIGRPSTYALIVSTVIDRKYVELKDRKLYASKLGMEVNKLLAEYFKDVINYEFTAHMEDELDTIANGDASYEKVVDDFYKPFIKDYQLAENKIKEIKSNLIVKTEIPCPECGEQTGAKMLKKWGRNGLFLTCERYPKCKATANIDEDVEKEEPQTEILCPECNSPMVLRVGRYGKFYGCINYPKCNGIRPYTLGIACPKCNQGEILPRMNKRKKLFYGCSRFPECDFITNYEPVSKQCDKCNNPYLEKRTNKDDTKYLYCPNCKSKFDLE
ncbi:MAG: type I DNA topoisomerase [Ignavibacteria bacterium]|nr:type I DNA topoisomerase [Ignavibacteria bacterium]